MIESSFETTQECSEPMHVKLVDSSLEMAFEMTQECLKSMQANMVNSCLKWPIKQCSNLG